MMNRIVGDYDVEDDAARELGYNDFGDFLDQAGVALRGSGDVSRFVDDWDRIARPKQALSRRQSRLVAIMGYQNPPPWGIGELRDLGCLTDDNRLTSECTREWLDACDILDHQ